MMHGQKNIKSYLKSTCDIFASLQVVSLVRPDRIVPADDGART